MSIMEDYCAKGGPVDTFVSFLVHGKWRQTSYLRWRRWRQSQVPVNQSGPRDAAMDVKVNGEWVRTTVGERARQRTQAKPRCYLAYDD